MEKCEDCDPSFGCFADPARCSKRTLELEGRVVGHSGKVLRLIRALDDKLAFEDPGDIVADEKLYALSAVLWRRLAQRNIQKGELQLVVLSEGGRCLITQVDGDDRQTHTELLLEHAGAHDIG